MNYSEYSGLNDRHMAVTDREQQNVDSSAYRFINYREQCNNDVSINRNNGHVPPCLIDVDSDLRHSMSRKFLYQPETSSIRTDCYNIDGSRSEYCDLSMTELTNTYIQPAQEETCEFNQILSGGCTPKFLQVTTVGSEPHLLEHTIQPFIRGGMNTRHHGRSSDLQNKRGDIRKVRYSH